MNGSLKYWCVSNCRVVKHTQIKTFRQCTYIVPAHDFYVMPLLPLYQKVPLQYNTEPCQHSNVPSIDIKIHIPRQSYLRNICMFYHELIYYDLCAWFKNIECRHEKFVWFILDWKVCKRSVKQTDRLKTLIFSHHLCRT